MERLFDLLFQPPADACVGLLFWIDKHLDDFRYHIS